MQSSMLLLSSLRRGARTITTNNNNKHTVRILTCPQQRLHSSNNNHFPQFIPYEQQQQQSHEEQQEHRHHDLFMSDMDEHQTNQHHYHHRHNHQHDDDDEMNYSGGHSGRVHMNSRPKWEEWSIEQFLSPLLTREEFDQLTRSMTESSFASTQALSSSSLSSTHDNHQKNRRNQMSATAVKNFTVTTTNVMLMIGGKVTWSTILQMMQSCFMIERPDLAEKIFLHLDSSEEYSQCLQAFHYGALIDVAIRYSPRFDCAQLFHCILAGAEKNESVKTMDQAQLFMLLRLVVFEDKVTWKMFPAMKRLTHWQMSRSYDDMSTIDFMRVMILFKRWKISGQKNGASKRAFILHYLTSLKQMIIHNGGLSEREVNFHSKLVIQVLELLYYLKDEKESKEWQEMARQYSIELNYPLIVNTLNAGTKKRGFNYGYQFLKDSENYFALKPDITLFNVVLTQAKTIAQVHSLLNEMNNQNISPNVSAFIHIIRLLVSQNRIDQAKMFYEQMQVHCGTDELNSVDLFLLVSAFGPGPETEGIVNMLQLRSLSNLTPKLIGLLWNFSKSFRLWMFEEITQPHFSILAPTHRDAIHALLRFLEHNDPSNYDKVHAIVTRQQQTTRYPDPHQMNN